LWKNLVFKGFLQYGYLVLGPLHKFVTHRKGAVHVKNTMKNLALSVLALGLGLGTASIAHADDPRISYLNCQAANSLGTAAVGLGTDGQVLIQTTSVLGTSDDRYDIAQVVRILENNRGSRVHLANKAEKQPGVLLVFSREMPTELSRLDGYLYSVSSTFNPNKDQTPSVPVAFVTCSIQFN
jgi:hypothetical protein